MSHLMYQAQQGLAAGIAFQVSRLTLSDAAQNSKHTALAVSIFNK